MKHESTTIAAPSARAAHERRVAPIAADVRVKSSPSNDRRITLAVLAVSAVYVAWHLNRGWIPFDDGTLAHSAERVLLGELPHRDFDDVYTGGLAYLNAGAFKLFGTTLLAMRLALFAVFLAWVPCVQYIGSRFVRPLLAAGVTLLAVTWSLPNYSAAMPSWYNLFFATFGVAALLRYLEDGKQRWLVIAGLVGGASIAIKIIGLYYVCGALLFFVFHAHSTSRALAGSNAQRGRAYATFVTASLALFVLALLSLVRHQPTASDVVLFVLPSAMLSALLIRNEWVSPAGTNSARFVALARLLAPFLLGAALPLAILLLPYVRAGALGAFAHGVFALPAKRFGLASFAPGPLVELLAVFPLAAVLIGASLAGDRVRGWMAAALAVACIALLVATGAPDGDVYRMVLDSARYLLPVLVAAGTLALARERIADLGSPLLRARCVLLLSVTSLCSLVQFPFAAPNYLFYIAPLVALSAIALGSYLRPMHRAVPIAVVGFYLAFAVTRLNPASLYTMSAAYRPYVATRPLPLARGGLRVPAEHAETYGHVVGLLRLHARGGYTWASPEMPEIYFLAGLRNPTRTLFEFFDDPTDHTARTLRALDSRGVTAIVLNRLPRFSPPLADDLIAGLEARYPYASNIGPFQVRWRR